MRCPKCQTSVPDGHFFCPNCHVSVYGYIPESGRMNGGRLERAGRRLLDLLLVLVLIGGGVVLARAIKWKELWNNFNPSAEVSAPAKPEQSPSGHATKRRSASTTTRLQGESAETSKQASGEGTPDPKPKVEGTSSKSETQPAPKPTATPAPTKPVPQ